LACLFLSQKAALAQSTATLEVETVTVTGARLAAFDGVVSQQDAPKTREVIDQAYISSQPTGANALSDLNLVPGITFTNDDPYGMSGSSGHLSIRGLAGANIGEMVDGVPLNDAGNYAIYAGELIDPEAIANVNVITGSSDVDAPSSSSLGGTVNINSLKPTDDMNGYVNTSYGSFNYWRIAGIMNTGEFGPWGTKAWIEASDQENSKYTGVGHDKKWQVNAKIYQPLHHYDDFIAIAGFYDRQVADFYFGDDFASFATTGVNAHPVDTTPGCYTYDGLLQAAQAGLLNPSCSWNNDYSKTYVLPSSTSTNSTFQGLEENPTWTGNLRGESSFTLLPNLHLTVDPSFQWVLANGAGSTNITGTDKRLSGIGLTTSLSNLGSCSTAGVISGIDLDGAVNAAGANICTDSVRLYSPSNTQTHRYTLNASLLWDITDTDVLQVSYALDKAKVRQTGEYELVQNNGYPANIFGGLAGYGTPVLTASGNVFQKRNRLSIPELNQFAVEYIGKFLDDTLRVDIGVRDPWLSRNLSQYCYTSPPTTVQCTNQASVATGLGATVLPFQIHTKYNKALPNVGVTYKLDDSSSIFADYTSAINAPVNDDLYAIAALGSGTTPGAPGGIGVKPETSTTTEAGYRYQTPMINATVDAYYLTDRNHIVQSYNQTTGDTTDINDGSVFYYGLEALLGVNPIENMTVVQSFAWEHSFYNANLPYSATVMIPAKGKAAADTPDLVIGERVTYKWNNVDLGLQAKYVDKRFVTILDDLAVPAYTTVDADIRFHLDDVTTAGTYLQFNVLNILNEQYIGSIPTGKFTDNSSLAYYSQPFATQGAPRTFQMSLHVPMPF
jgi:iron complex outermembrane receptor protein